MIDIEASLAAVGRQSAEGCVKTWEDLERYQAVIEATNPDLIIECGTFSGKSALWFARNSEADIVTMDVTPYIDPPIRVALDRFYVNDYTCSSTDPEMVATVAGSAAAHKRVMVVLDSDHSAPHVLAEMHAYGPLVTPGCYMVVEDTLLRHMPGEERRHYDGNPWDAVDEWMAVHGDEWELDTEIEAMHPVTQFPGGWLRRKLRPQQDTPGVGGTPVGALGR